MSAKIEFTETEWGKLDALLQFKVSLAFCSDYLGVSRDTIIRRIKEKYDLTFAEYHNLKMENTATKLQQKAIEMALKGNTTMMIFALKNLAKWSDKQEVKQETFHDHVFNIVEYDFDEKEGSEKGEG